MAQDNEQICLLAFNVFSLVCVLYSCSGIYELAQDYNKLKDQEEKDNCMPYLIWKIVFLLHIIFFFICLSFAVGTAQSYLNEEENEEEEEGQNRSVRRLRLKFDQMIENSMDVIRIFCILFCGPFVMVECILSLVFYQKVTNECQISDSFTNILIYVLIIMGFISLTITGFCCYMSFFFFKSIRSSWSQLRRGGQQENNEIVNNNDAQYQAVQNNQIMDDIIQEEVDRYIRRLQEQRREERESLRQDTRERLMRLTQVQEAEENSDDEVALDQQVDFNQKIQFKSSNSDDALQYYNDDDYYDSEDNEPLTQAQREQLQSMQDQQNQFSRRREDSSESDLSSEQNHRIN